MSVYKKYVMPVVVSVALIGGYNWVTEPEIMNEHLVVAPVLDINSIEPAMGPVDEAVSATEVVAPVSVTEIH